MKKRLARIVGIAALVAEAALLIACSSSSKGGSPGTGTTGSGGSTSAVGSGASPIGTETDGGAQSAKYDVACVAVNNKAACNMTTDKPCANTCGPNKSGYKNCDCVAGLWSCPTCSYEPGTDVSCYKVTDATPLCPTDSTDLTGMGLPISGAACSQTDCTPCGSKSQNAYRDTSGSPKQGFCICVHADPTMPGKYSCTSIKEYPPTAIQ